MPASHARPHLPGLFSLHRRMVGGPIVVQGKMGSSYSPGIGIPSCQYQERQTFLLFYLYCFRLYLFCTIPPSPFRLLLLLIKEKSRVSLSLRHAPQKKKRKYISSSVRNPSHTTTTRFFHSLSLRVNLNSSNFFIFIFVPLFDCEFNLIAFQFFSSKSRTRWGERTKQFTSALLEAGDAAVRDHALENVAWKPTCSTRHQTRRRDSDIITETHICMRLGEINNKKNMSSRFGDSKFKFSTSSRRIFKSNKKL